MSKKIRQQSIIIFPSLHAISGLRTFGNDDVENVARNGAGGLRAFIEMWLL
jgi:hypothetical protein